MFDRKPAPKVITFDCYGTLVQWYEVLIEAVGAILERSGNDTVDALTVINRFSQHSRRLTADKKHVPYKQILQNGFAAAFRDAGVAVESSDIDGIISSLKPVGPHPEVPDVLRRMRQRYKLAIITNSDNDLIAPTVEKIGVPFDYVVTAEQAQSYKPSRKLFDYAYRHIGVAHDETVHVAMGMYTDMKVCHELGLRAIWVNRRGEVGNADWLPYTEVSDLKEAGNLLLEEA